jgi:hypothetical protein
MEGILAFMQELRLFEQIALYTVLAIAVLGLLYALFLRAQVLREPKGSSQMQEVWNAIRIGADTCTDDRALPFCLHRSPHPRGSRAI